MSKSQRSKDNYLTVQNPNNLKLRWTKSECDFCPGRLFPAIDPVTDSNGNILWNEIINIDLDYWDRYKVRVCDQCVLCLIAIYD